MPVYGHLRRKSYEFWSQGLRRYFILSNIPIWAVSKRFSTKPTLPTRGIFLLSAQREGPSILDSSLIRVQYTWWQLSVKWSALHALLEFRVIENRVVGNLLMRGFGEVHDKRHLQTELSSEDGLSGSHKVKVRFLSQVPTVCLCTNLPHFWFSLRFGGRKKWIELEWSELICSKILNSRALAADSLELYSLSIYSHWRSTRLA